MVVFVSWWFYDGCVGDEVGLCVFDFRFSMACLGCLLLVLHVA